MIDCSNPLCLAQTGNPCSSKRTIQAHRPRWPLQENVHNQSLSLSLSLDRILQHKIDGFADSCFMSWQTERGVPGAPCLIMGSSWMYTPHFLTSSAARAQKSCLATTCSRVLCVFVCVMQYLSQNEAKSKSWRKLLVLPR